MKGEMNTFAWLPLYIVTTPFAFGCVSGSFKLSWLWWKSLRTSSAAHQGRTYPSLCSTESDQEFQLCSDGMPVYRRITFNINSHVTRQGSSPDRSIRRRAQQLWGHRATWRMDLKNCRFQEFSMPSQHLGTFAISHKVSFSCVTFVFESKIV